MQSAVRDADAKARPKSATSTAYCLLLSPAPAFAFFLGPLGSVFTTMALTLKRDCLADVLSVFVAVGAPVGAAVPAG